MRHPKALRHFTLAECRASLLRESGRSNRWANHLAPYRCQLLRTMVICIIWVRHFGKSELIRNAYSQLSKMKKALSLDELPIRDRNSELQALAETAFEAAIANERHFVVQSRDRRDYGTDFQVEATHSGGMTNFRVHTQLKATNKAANKDGSISISVARTNLNYMLSQPNSIYVCYHSPTQALFVRSAENVFRDADHEGEEWRSQKNLTIRFHVPFDADFQSTLCRRTIANSTVHRDDRLHWVATPPADYSQEVATNIPTITVPESPNEAFDVLKSLYERGQDEVISKAYEQFCACFPSGNLRLRYVFFSEINLAMDRKRFNRERVTAAIEFIELSRPDNGPDALYCRANGHAALGLADEATRLYREAIQKAGGETPKLTAQCWKNLGTVLEKAGDHAEARSCFEKAISLSPDLMEAQMALAIHHRNAGNSEEALHYFDLALEAMNDVAPALAARGHRLEIYFRLGMTDKAFDDTTVLLPNGNQHPWIFDWCALLVFNYARTNESSISRSIRFWDAYLKMRPLDRRAQRERLLCLAYAKMHGQAVALDLETYVADVSDYLSMDSRDAAYLWDRVGHWAQVEENWEQAEQHYRKAYSLEPDRYGYCLGTALNFLKRFDEALPILLDQATTHQPDAQSWFQVAISQEGTGDVASCQRSYKRALSLDPEYDIAMFNLAGTYWNHGPRSEAIRLWSDALKRFPSHSSSSQIRREFPGLFGDSGVK